VKILADENIPPELVQWLREQGHDVVSIRETARGTLHFRISSNCCRFL